ncbi:MAG TPA: IS1595 family transposase [Candidatus Methylacidiphilales bacterium]|jgi:transposase-like protein|nr:IS1595 family transposase [Candidatus Methylacidiphilales bacterium]
MSTLLPTPKELTLDQIQQHFSTDAQARQYLEAVRWPNGVVCPHCKNADQSKFWKLEGNKEKKIREGIRQCAACGKQFTCTVGTIFEDSKIPLRKWLLAWYLMCSSKKGISACQIQRMLDLGSYRTAWMMMHKIRHALRDPIFVNKLGGTVEVDETYIGGRKRGMGRCYKGNKTAVVSLVERGGSVRSKTVPIVTGKNIRSFLTANVDKSTDIMTDNYQVYPIATKGFKSHQSVNHHKREFVRGNVHTNTVEGYFSLLKRGVIGTFHHVSRKHLPLYLSEFDHRYSNRNVTDGERTVNALKKMEGKRLTYKKSIKTGP